MPCPFSEISHAISLLPVRIRLKIVVCSFSTTRDKFGRPVFPNPTVRLLCRVESDYITPRLFVTSTRAYNILDILFSRTANAFFPAFLRASPSCSPLLLRAHYSYGKGATAILLKRGFFFSRKTGNIQSERQERRTAGRYRQRGMATTVVLELRRISKAHGTATGQHHRDQSYGAVRQHGVPALPGSQLGRANGKRTTFWETYLITMLRTGGKGP